MKWAGACSTQGEMRNAYNILIGEPENWKVILEWMLGK
jgi:hypothetical protein